MLKNVIVVKNETLQVMIEGVTLPEQNHHHTAKRGKENNVFSMTGFVLTMDTFIA
jgi:hypothetical protein